MENIKKLYRNIKFKISTPMWNDQCELSDGPYFVSGTQEIGKSN